MLALWTVLGAGTASPHPSRSPSGHLVRAPGGPILVDMGAGTLWRLARAGVDWTDLEAIFLSHAHLDHTLDLQALMFAARIPHDRSRPLPIYVGPGMMVHIDRWRGALGKWFDPVGFEVSWRTVEAEIVEVAGLKVEIAPVLHHATSIGLRFSVPGGPTVAYSGDSDVCDALVGLCEGADLAVLECSLDDGDKHPGHMTPSDVARVAFEAGARRVALVHRYPSLDGVDAAASVQRAGYSGAVVAAEDGDAFDVGAEGG